MRRGRKQQGTCLSRYRDNPSGRRALPVLRCELRVALREPSNVDGTPGHVSAFAYTIDRANNIGASRTIITELAIVPRGSIEDVNTTLRYAFALPAVA